MSKGEIPNSIKKNIRREKARIRREVFDFKRQEELIGKLYQSVTGESKPEK